MTRRRKSVWDRLEEKLIFKPTTRTPRKKKLTPTEIPTYDHTATLIDSMWLRRRARRNTAIILACAYCFVAGQFFEFLSKNEPSLTTVKSLLLSLSWPGNAVLFLLMRCVR